MRICAILTRRRSTCGALAEEPAFHGLLAGTCVGLIASGLVL
jgi:hypothetical protein